MKTQLHRRVPVVSSGDAPEVGTLRRVSEDGKPFVEYRGSQGERVARCAATEAPLVEECIDAPVLLVFECGDRSLPIIVGFVRDSLWEVPGRARTQANHIANARFSAKMEGDTVVIEGKDAVELRCGQGSISLHADGHIVIKGERVTSRARETNKVRGAVVLIN